MYGSNVQERSQMFCKYCGTEINTSIREADGTVVCPGCGTVYRSKSATQPPQEQAPIKAENKQSAGMNGAGRKSAHNAPRKKREHSFVAPALATVIVIAILLGGYFAFIKPNTVSFDFGYGADDKPLTQLVKRGKCAAEPATPERTGYIFIGWYSDNSQSRPYDFSTTVTKSFTLTGKWADLNDTQDTDGDGLVDSIEKSIGTDINRTDTDNDGLSDYTEFKVLGLDPLIADTDHNGVPDGDEDTDSDGLLNNEEVTYNTSPLFTDTDGDGLSDYEEVKVYKTSPHHADTDQDGADDKTEIRIGSDPLSVQQFFTTTISSAPISDANTVSLTVSAETDGAGAGKLTVTPLVSTNIPALSIASYGYLGYAYEVHTNGVLENATLSFSYDQRLGELSETFIPCIYYYDEAKNELIELENQHVENGIVVASTNHFSIYTILNKYLVEAAKNYSSLPSDAELIDSNNDGIPDYYAQRINEGTLLYDNSDTLVGVLDMYGTDNDDWDVDGVKNGEEISIEIGIMGNPVLRIVSNPLLRDSDFDGISDYSEIYQLGTDPLRYDRKSVGALHQLQNDSQYLYMIIEKDWRTNLAEFFDYRKYDEAKACLINYFYDYAPEETVLKNAEQIERQAAFEEYLKIYNTVSSLTKAARDINSTLEVGAQNAALEAHYYESIDMRKNMLSEINMGKAEIATISGQLSLFSLPDDISNIITSLNSGSPYQQIAGSTKIISMATAALNTYQKACQYHIYSLAKEFGDYTKGADVLDTSAKLPSASQTLSIVCDIIEAGDRILEVNATYSKLKANADAYNMYTELLLYIHDHAAEDYVRNAAGDIAKIVMDNGCAEYFFQLAEACNKELTITAFKVALDTLAKENPYVAIAKIFLDLYQKTGMTDLAKYNVYFEVMQEVSKGSKALLSRAIREETQTFSYRSEYSAWVEKYLVQLAQSRIIGEYYFHEYCASNSGASFIANLFSGLNAEDYRRMFSDEAKNIYGYANRLKLKLSKKLPKYDLYWNDSVSEDSLELSSVLAQQQEISMADTEALQAYLSTLERERDLIQAYTWQMGYYGYGPQPDDPIPRPVVLCDVYGDETPELIYVKRADDADYWAHLEIVTFEGGQVRVLFSRIWDTKVAGGQGYYFYQINGEKALYLYDSTGDDWWKNTYYYAEENADGSLSFTGFLQRDQTVDYTAAPFTQNVDYIRNGESISEDEFAREEAMIQAKTTCILIYNTKAGEFARSYAASHGCPAMTCDEAIAYLRSLLGLSDPYGAEETEAEQGGDKTWNELYRGFVLNREYETVEGMQPPADDSDEISFCLYDMDRDGTPELLARSYPFCVLSVWDGKVRVCGTLDYWVRFYTEFCCYPSQSAYPGIFTRERAKGHYRIVYHAMENGLLSSNIVEEGTYDGGRDFDESRETGTVSERTGDEALYRFSASTSDMVELIFYTRSEIQEMGWDSFARTFSEETATTAETYPGINPEMFRNSSSVFNIDLALLCAELSQDTYDLKTLSTKIRDMGFDGAESFNYSKSDRIDYENENCFFIAHDRMKIDGEDTVILCIICRGTQTDGEKLGDFFKGLPFDITQDFHSYQVWDHVYDFYEQVEIGLEKYLSTRESIFQADRLVVVVTGHSLGGAAADLVGAEFAYRMAQDPWCSIGLRKEDVYVYTFGAIKVIANGDNAEFGFENIHNIYNYFDSFGPYGNYSPLGVSSPDAKFGHVDLYRDQRFHYEEFYLSFENHHMKNYLSALEFERSVGGLLQCTCSSN